MTDASGAVVAEFDYELYGEQVVVSGDADATRFLFAGEYLDPAGDYYLRNRVFDPRTAVFLSVDPVLTVTGMPFAYTAGNPLQGTDPLGLYGWGDFGGDLASVGSVVWDEVSSPEFIASTVVFVGCTTLTAGAGTLACATAAGAVYGAVAYGANTPPECMSWGGFFTQTMTGAATGFIGGAVFGPVGARVVTAARTALNNAAPVFLRQSVSSVTGSGAQAIRTFTNNLTQRTSTTATNSVGRAADETIDLYSAVGIREYESVMSSGRFAPAANSLEGRQFALSLDEALVYAYTDLSKVAVLRATVTRSAVEGAADFSTRIDPFIFRSGVFTVQPGRQSDLFHAGLWGVSHAF
ncbi:RHS repeat-associated core domain-containing protein [Demequina oxidasica]|uniref:RHS repeat-associated core domain-containing protein n=1 Tax=Demequina oxidasica TaxID=676199 RepID=UPI001364AECC|nr:RHS repeat-associated core domain-containing protein [Demequina oxidasica]